MSGEPSRESSVDVRRVSTESVAEQRRFDFWRSLFNTVNMRRDGEVGRPFRGELVQFPARSGSQFNHLRVDALQNQYCAKPADGPYLLTLVFEGRVEMSDAAGASVVATGGLFLSDTARGARVRHSRYSMAYLKLPRAWVHETLGRDPLPARAGFLRLTHERLAPFLSSQLALLSSRGAALGVEARAAVLESAIDLGVALLRQQLGTHAPGPALPDDGLFAAAKLYIEQQCHRAELTPEAIAAAVGCSRSRLYRLFAERELAVYELIRELRLERSRALLEAPDRPSIAAIAFDAGFADLSTFNRAFKRRFGTSPGDWRLERSAEGETRGQVDWRRSASTRSPERSIDRTMKAPPAPTPAGAGRGRPTIWGDHDAGATLARASARA